MNIKGGHQNLPIIGFGDLSSYSIMRLPHNFAQQRDIIIQENLKALAKNLRCFNDIVFLSAIKDHTEEEIIKNITTNRNNNNGII